jgi:hypothetical protein
MDRFAKCFRREAEGVWICLQPATLELPHGRIQVAAGTRLTLGTRFMNMELARMLDDHYRLIAPRDEA